ncbi:MAG: sulfite exporter TauE/SafE family protein [Pseudomonadota bacterium]
MDSLIVVVALGAIAAGFVQGLSGFGFGLVAMSFWAWTVEPQLAAVLAVFGSLAGQLLAVLTVKRRVEAHRLLPFVLGGVLGVPIGVWLLPMLDANLFKAVLGALLVTWGPAMLLARQLPRIRRGGRVADGLVGAVGGVMGGIGGFTGSVPTLWCTLRGFDKDTQRAVIQNFNLATLAVAFGIYLARGFVTSAMLPMLAIVAAALALPALLGARLYIGISETTFRQIVLGLLTLSGVALLASSVPRLIGV